MQQRLKKYTRDPNALAAFTSRQITTTSLTVIATIHDYKIIPTSLIIRLVPGHEKNVQRHLQQLYHKGLINRFAFMRGKNPSEFYYYLDNPEALELLVQNGVDRDRLEFDEVRRNREKRYCDVNDPKRTEEMQGKLLFLKHEVMISRFHGMLELACAASTGSIELTNFEQGPRLWTKVEVPKLAFRNGAWVELDETEQLPHRPDASSRSVFQTPSATISISSTKLTVIEPTPTSTTKNYERTFTLWLSKNSTASSMTFNVCEQF